MVSRIVCFLRKGTCRTRLLTILFGCSAGSSRLSRKPLCHYEIGSCVNQAAKARRIRVGFDTDQTRFRTIRHQALRKAGSAANIDHPVAGDKVQLFDNPLAPEMFAGEQTIARS